MNTIHLFCLIALSICKLITCHPIQKETIQTDLTRENVEDKISSYGLFLMAKLTNGIEKAIYRESNGAVLLKKISRDCFSLLDTKRLILMCLDTTKKPYISVDNTNDCFKTIQRKIFRHAMCSWRNDAETKELPPPPTHLNNHNSHLRLRRSHLFDPTDPLGSENPKSRTVNYRRQNKEHEHTGNVSRETITSCDDPLHVLLSKSPVSPNLQKEKKHKQVAPINPF
ncbi:uncharacterized protein LOC130219702 [Danio aesculapii]|uniref:uncharacterized protein LOC130219702 n=1 Tax=Danio aesculapii TaxID=1142201 RepID=UPI0024BF10B7|nr:uncharacterized protein LOC130219702 [Danio aesculapii]